MLAVVRTLAFAAAAAVPLVAAAAAYPAQHVSPSCNGNPVKVFDNSNKVGVQNGGKAPTFSTNGKSYCLVTVVTYHWNGGHGKPPGSVGVKSSTMSASSTAYGSPGQGGAQNVNWTGTFAKTEKIVISGIYSCFDSDPSTWSQNTASRGKGFCIVYGVPTSAPAGVGGHAAGATKPSGTKVKVSINTKVGAVTVSGGLATKKSSSKLAITATPDNGKPPLAVTFALGAPKVVQWRVDFGDGLFRTGFGQPPASLAHTYAKDGDFKPRLTVLSAQGGTPQSAATSVSVAATPLLSLVANPTSGNPPLAVVFKVATSIQNITTWAIDFGDGTKGGGAGTPPATLYHTYTKAGTYKPQIAVKPGQYSLVYSVAQVVVGGGTPPVLSISARPSKGTHPLTVTFALTTSVPGQLVSWEVIFGDGYRTTGQGAPPASVTHTYAKAGTYAAYLVVAQQQQYGGVQFTVPRGGLAISVG
jgi:PKD repeat protein